ncbi:MAG: AAA family ATPase, partial [Nitrospirae bacterium]
AILFFDEADTFLFPRKNALRSWEVSFTNEFLTQIENFQGIVVFATNHIEGLDTAALRRFRFKVEFRPLKPEGVVRLYEKLLMPLIPEANALTEEILERLRDIKGLTPGDFATVREKFLFLEPSDITHERLLEALKEEVAYREGEKRISGFMCS